MPVSRPIPPLSARDAERFWVKVDRSGGPDACWIWTGSRAKRGYGRFGIGLRVFLASRVAWYLEYGEDPGTSNVLHACDNPPCVNVRRHGFLGTQADNVRDMVAKGRSCKGRTDYVARGAAHYAKREPYRLPRGERHGSARFTIDEVHAIREATRAGRLSLGAAAKHYGVTKRAISQIRDGRTWTHV